MKLLDAIHMIYSDDKGYNDEIAKMCLKCINNRLEWLEEREPESPAAYDNWSEKYDELSDISDNLSNIIETFKTKNEVLINDIEDFVNDICDYQICQGGLSRLKL